MTVTLADIQVDEAAFYGRHAYGRFPEQISVWDLFDGCDGYVGHHRTERYPLSGLELDLWIDWYVADDIDRSMYEYLYN